jgi:hypothetical protein
VDAGSGGGVETAGTERSESPDDVYAMADCDSTLRASTCGASEFRSLIEVRGGSLAQEPQACSAWGNGCATDARGATAEVAMRSGLAFIIVDGATADDAGGYQLVVSY